MYMRDFPRARDREAARRGATLLAARALVIRARRASGARRGATLLAARALVFRARRACNRARKLINFSPMAKIQTHCSRNFIAQDRAIKIEGREYIIPEKSRASKARPLIIKNAEAAKIRAEGSAPIRAESAPLSFKSQFPRIAKKRIRAEKEKLRALENKNRARKTCEELPEIELYEIKPHSELRADCALRAILPPRGALFRELRAIARAMKSGAARRGAEFPRARFSALVQDQRRALFGARIGALVAHRLEYGSPRKRVAKLTRAAATKKIRLVKLQIQDRENVISNVRALAIAREWNELDLFIPRAPRGALFREFSEIRRAALVAGNFNRADFCEAIRERKKEIARTRGIALSNWKAIYSNARAAIRPLVLSYKGAEGATSENDPQATTPSEDGKKSFSTMALAIGAEDQKRAALVRFLIRAAMKARDKEKARNDRQWRANFKSALAKIRAIGTRAGSAGIIDSQSSDSQARAAALANSARRFAKYIREGADFRELELKSFRELPIFA